MKARFAAGPYDGVVLELPNQLDHVHLPVKVACGLVIPEDRERVWYCQAVYRLTVSNDYESTYQFESISAP